MRKLLAYLFLLIFASSPAWAGLASANFNYINDFIGDRAMGLGGAFTAISDDPSGSYYNPAGLAFAYDNQISLSVNTLKVKKVQYEKAVARSESYNQNLESLYPSFFGVIQSFGDVKVALNFMNVNNEILDQDDHYYDVAWPDTFGGPSRNLNTDVHINYNNTDNTLLGGFSAGFFVSKSITFGVSILGLRRRQEQIFQQIVRIKSDPESLRTPESYNHANNYITDIVTGGVGRVGLQWMPTNNISTGVSVGGGTIINHSRETQSFNVTNPQTFDNTGFSITDTDLTGSSLPVDARAGIAFIPNQQFLISADVITHWGTKYYDTTVENTINGALGVEYFVTNSFATRAGAFTNFANTPKIDASKKGDMHADLYGFSAGLSWQTRSSSVTLSGFYQFGNGEAQITDTLDIQNVNISMYQISLTGTAKY